MNLQMLKLFEQFLKPYCNARQTSSYFKYFSKLISFQFSLLSATSERIKPAEQQYGTEIGICQINNLDWKMENKWFNIFIYLKFKSIIRTAIFETRHLQWKNKNLNFLWILNLLLFKILRQQLFVRSAFIQCVKINLSCKILLFLLL